jgi:hypothetical protein
MQFNFDIPWPTSQPQPAFNNGSGDDGLAAPFTIALWRPSDWQQLSTLQFHQLRLVLAAFGERSAAAQVCGRVLCVREFWREALVFVMHAA